MLGHGNNLRENTQFILWLMALRNGFCSLFYLPTMLRIISTIKQNNCPQGVKQKQEKKSSRTLLLPLSLFKYERNGKCGQLIKHFLEHLHLILFLLFHHLPILLLYCPSGNPSSSAISLPDLLPSTPPISFHISLSFVYNVILSPSLLFSFFSFYIYFSFNTSTQIFHFSLPSYLQF